jgi:hypothetical protein
LLYTWLVRSYNPCHGFGGLTPVLFIFFNWQFLFQFHHLTLGWLRIKFHDLFWFALYKVISVSLLKSRVWRVNLFNSSLYWPFLLEFFLFHPSTFGWLWIRPHELFWFAFYGVISVLCSGHVFCGLTRINSYCFVVSYF